jgi:hypothetical protein
VLQDVDGTSFEVDLRAALKILSRA